MNHPVAKTIDNIYLTRDWKRRQSTPINKFTQRCSIASLVKRNSVIQSVFYKMANAGTRARKKSSKRKSGESDGNDDAGSLSL